MDEAFVKVNLDEKSVSFFKKNLFKIKCLLTRILIWSDFYNMVRDAKLTALDFLEIVKE
jgi:hypothetical protein